MRDYLPILLQVAVVLGFGVVTLMISVILGKSARRTAAKDMAYECGMLPQGEAQPRFSVKFYLVAMLFILFDIEVVFLYPWAVNFKEMLKSHGSTIFWSMTGFLSLVTVGYVYAIRKGVLDWKKG
jgi:NADH-quinone oxidoreductase subunit A